MGYIAVESRCTHHIVDLGVGEAEWAFKTTFDTTQDDLAYSNVDLVFEGLDTFASVTLVRNRLAGFRLALMMLTEWQRDLQVCLLFLGGSPVNGLHRSSNQFIGHRIAVKNDLKVGANELLLHFESAFLKVATTFAWQKLSDG